MEVRLYTYYFIFGTNRNDLSDSLQHYAVFLFCKPTLFIPIKLDWDIKVFEGW